MTGWNGCVTCIHKAICYALSCSLRSAVLQVALHSRVAESAKKAATAAKDRSKAAKRRAQRAEPRTLTKTSHTPETLAAAAGVPMPSRSSAAQSVPASVAGWPARCADLADWTIMTMTHDQRCFLFLASYPGDRRSYYIAIPAEWQQAKAAERHEHVEHACRTGLNLVLCQVMAESHAKVLRHCMLCILHA